MKIFVTGANGFIGSSLVNGLSSTFDYVHGIIREQHLSESFLSAPTALSLDYSAAKLNDFFRQNRPDVLIHCIGSPTVGWAQENPFFDYLSAVNSVSMILEAIRLYSPDSHLVLISSAAVYGNQDANLLREDLPLRPCSIYGSHKALAEQLTMNYVNFYKLKASIIRPFSVYGPGLKKQVIFDLISKFTKIKYGLIEIKGIGMEARDFIHINDVVSGVEKIIQTGYAGVINLGTGKKTTLTELASMIQGLVNQNVDYKFLGGINDLNPLSLIADTTKALQIGITPSTLLSLGLAEAVRHSKVEI